MIARLLTTFAGIALIVYGAVAAVSPLPLGIPLIVLGVMMIALANPAARPLIRRMRRKWRWFDFLVRKMSASSPKPMREVIEETEPGESEKNEAETPDDAEGAAERTAGR